MRPQVYFMRNSNYISASFKQIHYLLESLILSQALHFIHFITSINIKFINISKMGCNESTAQAHSLPQTKQKVAKPQAKKASSKRRKDLKPRRKKLMEEQEEFQQEPLEEPERYQEAEEEPPQKQKQKQKQTERQKQKQKQRQKQSRRTKNQWPLDLNNFNKLPESVKDKYKKAKEKGRFDDSQFPPNDTSLGKPLQAKRQQLDAYQDLVQILVWQRPEQFLGPDFVLFDGIDPEDIVQGELGNCYCLATISVYAQTPQQLVELFPFYDLQIGFYVLRFYTNGKPNFVVIDDYFPCDRQQNVPLFTKPMGNEIWVLLIEKAWAKIIGSYYSAEGMSPDFFMEDLTGCPSYPVGFQQKDNKVDEVVSCSNAGYLVVLGSYEDNQEEGIVGGHAYSLLQAVEYEGAFIFKIRNPWGAFEWDGQYGEESDLWTPQLRKICGEKKGDDGIFFLSEDELLEFFQDYSVGMIAPNAKYSFLEFQSQPQEQLFFKFKLTKKGNMAIRVTQPFDRLVKDKNYKYSPMVFEVGKIENGQVLYFSEGGKESDRGDKSIYATDEVCNECESGEYFVRVKMQWVNPKKYNTAVFSVYCQENVAIERMKQPQGLKLWKSMVSDFMQDSEMIDLDDDIAYATEWMKGQMICYATIKEGSEVNNPKLRWTFNANEFINCKLGLNKKSESVIEFAIDSKEGFNFGIVNKVELSEQQCEASDPQVQLI